MDVKADIGRIELEIDELVGLEMEVPEEPWEIEEMSELGMVDKPGITSGESLVRKVSATMTLRDESAGEFGATNILRLHGVHWPRIGTLLLTTTSEKFDGIF